MKRLRFYALAISVLLFIFSLFFAAKPHPVSQLLVMAAFAGLVVLYSGYLYFSTGEIESDPESLRRWPRHSKINDNWFRIGD